jgi:hypothetical protein
VHSHEEQHHARNQADFDPMIDDTDAEGAEYRSAKT